MKYLELLVNALNKISMILAGIAVLALMVLATGNVVLRIFHIPYRAAYESVSFLGALVIAGALGYTQQRKNHIVVDILTEKFPKKAHRFLDIINYGITLVFFGIMAWQTYLFGMKIWESHEVSETLKVIFHPFIFGVSIGFALLSLNLFLDFLKALLSKGDK